MVIFATNLYAVSILGFCRIERGAVGGRQSVNKGILLCVCFCLQDVDNDGEAAHSGVDNWDAS